MLHEFDLKFRFVWYTVSTQLRIDIKQLAIFFVTRKIEKCSKDLYNGYKIWQFWHLDQEDQLVSML
jgi:hypothetical protein